MSKYNSFRHLLGTGAIDWPNSDITISVVDNYSFNASDETLADIDLAGADILATTRISNRSVSDDGWAIGSSALFTSVASGGPYDLIICLDTNAQRSGAKLLVHFNNAVTAASNGDVIVDPDGGGSGATGNWFKF